MYILHTVGFDKDDMNDDVALAKRFVVSFWTEEMQQYQPRVVEIGMPNNTWEISVPRRLLDEAKLICWKITNGDKMPTRDDQFVTLRFELPNKVGTIVSITKNYKENLNERKSD